MRSEAKEVIYTGMSKGRPHFEFGPVAPPKWLYDLYHSPRMTWDKGRLMIDGRPIEPGEKVKDK